MGWCDGPMSIYAVNFLAYAQDWDGDGKQDIWQNKADIFASIAHYLQQAGWRNDLTWGRRVELPRGFANAAQLVDAKHEKPWRNGAMGMN